MNLLNRSLSSPGFLCERLMGAMPKVCREIVRITVPFIPSAEAEYVFNEAGGGTIKHSVIQKPRAAISMQEGRGWLRRPFVCATTASSGERSSETELAAA